MKVKQELEKLLGKEIAQSSNEEVYYALLNLTKQLADDRRMEETKKKIYYVSAEFLIGKLLSNNMINLGIYEDVKKVLAESEKTLAEIEEIEVEHLLEMAVWGDLLHVSLIQSQHLDYRVRVLD